MVEFLAMASLYAGIVPPPSQWSADDKSLEPLKSQKRIVHGQIAARIIARPSTRWSTAWHFEESLTWGFNGTW